jgi:hypothetical protein
MREPDEENETAADSAAHLLANAHLGARNPLEKDSHDEPVT